MNVLVSMLTLAFLLLPVSPVHAYYDDIHYHYTYYIARAVGYTPEQSFRIASGNVSIDWDPETEPVQSKGQAAMVAAAAASFAVDPIGNNWKSIRAPIVALPSLPRIKFHAMMDCMNWELCLSDPVHEQNARAAIPKYHDWLWQSALNSGNLGAYLHFLEDMPSHEGYPSDNGHWTAIDLWWHGKKLIMGARTDYLDYEGLDGKRDTTGIINEVINRMTAFMRIKIPKQQLRDPALNSRSPEINKLYRVLRKVNPASQAPGFQQSGEYLGKQLKKRRTGSEEKHEIQTKYLGLIAPNLKPLIDAVISGMDFMAYWKTGAEPESRPAYDVVKVALKKYLKGTEGTYSFEHFPYNFDSEGGIVGPDMKDKWVLYGDLQTEFAFYKNGKPVYDFASEFNVKIKSVPTYAGRKPYLLDETNTYGVHRFTQLPIGYLKVEVYHFGTIVHEETIFLDRQIKLKRLKINLDEEYDFLEFDEHLSRIKVLREQARESAKAYTEVDKKLEKEIREQNGRIDAIKRILERGNDPEQLRQQAEGIAMQADRQASWSSAVSDTLVLLERAQRKLVQGKEQVCSCLETSGDRSDEEHSEQLMACSKKWDSLDITSLEAEAAFTQAESAIQAYKRFADSLRELQELSPESVDEIRLALESLFEQAESDLDRMADLMSDLSAGKRESQDIFEFVRNSVAAKSEKLKIKATAGADVSTRIERFEKLPALFAGINEEIQGISIQEDHRIVHREKVQALSDSWSELHDEITEYLNTVDFDLPQLDDARYRNAQAEFGHAEAGIADIRQLIEAGQACSQSLTESSNKAEQEISMPNLKGLYELEVEALLARIGLGGISLPGSDAPEEDLTAKVEKQEPAGDTTIKPGATVRYWIYRPFLALDGLFEAAKSALGRCDFSVMGKSREEIGLLNSSNPEATRLLAELEREIDADKAFQKAERAYLNGELDAAERLLAQANATQCEARRAGIAQRISKIDRLRKVLARVDRVVYACDRKAAMDLHRRLAGQTHKLLRESAVSLESVIAAAEPLSRSLRAYRAGELNQAEALLEKVDSDRCPDLAPAITQQRERINRLREQLARVDKTVNSCDAGKADTLARELSSENHGALRKAVALLSGMAKAVQNAKYLNDTAESAYFDGDLKGARERLQSALGDLNRIGSNVCRELRKTISGRQARISKLTQLLQKADAVIARCDEHEIQTLQARLSSQSHVLVKAKSGELTRALARCAEPKPTPKPVIVEKERKSPPTDTGNNCRVTQGEGAVAVTGANGQTVCRCDDSSLQSRDGKRCLPRSQVIADGERYCANKMSRGILKSAKAEGDYECGCPTDAGYYDEINRECLDWKGVIAHGERTCRESGKLLGQVKAFDSYICCPSGMPYYEQSNNTCYRENASTRAANEKERIANENKKSAEEIFQGLTDLVRTIKGAKDGGNTQWPSPSGSSGGGANPPTWPFPSGTGGGGGSLPTWPSTSDGNTGGNGNSAACNNLTQELTRNGNDTQSLARQYSGQKDLACRMYRLAAEQQAIIQKLKRTNCPGAASIPVTQIQFNQECP